MNETETTYPAADSGVAQLRNELDALRFLLSAALLIIFVFSLAVNIFLFRQSNMVSGQYNEMQNLVFRYENGGAGQVYDFWTKLNDFSRQHPDFNPIINKYSPFIALHTNAANALPAAAAAAPKKK